MSGESQKLGRVSRINIREVWPDEAKDFTPWLAEQENLDILADTLGMDLRLEATERNVGQYRADIVCKDAANNEWVLIENQLERTDHSHLGQLITYAAGLDAVSIVWLADYFSEEHRAALDWLNEQTSDNLNFFGVEIQVWQIDESRRAPQFSVVSRPNAWTKGRGGNKPIKRPDRLEYWTKFSEYLAEKAPDLKPSRPTDGASMDIGVDWKDLFLMAGGYEDTDHIFVRLSGRREATLPLFTALLEEKDAVESEFGDSVFRAGKLGRPNIEVNRPGTIAIGGDAEADYRWYVETIQKLNKVLGDRISRVTGAS